MRIAAIALLIAAGVGPATAGGSSQCRTTLGPGHQVEGHIYMGLIFGLYAHRLAEWRCGAAVTSMKTEFLGSIKKHGCGPSTEIYKETAKTINQLEKMNINQAFGSEGGSKSDKESSEQADSMLKEFGGCEGVLLLHDKGVEAWAKEMPKLHPELAN